VIERARFQKQQLDKFGIATTVPVLNNIRAGGEIAANASGQKFTKCEVGTGV
jgi:hypothetical protein